MPVCQLIWSQWTERLGKSSPTMTQRFGVLLPETPFLYLVSAQQLGLLRDEFPSGSLVEASRE